MIDRRTYARAVFLPALAGAAFFANGCGGTKISGNEFGATPSAEPAVLGRNANLGTLVSALVTPAPPGDNAVPRATDLPYITFAIASDASPLPSIAENGTVPLGLGGVTVFADDTTRGIAVGPNAPVAFRAYIVNGQSADTNVSLGIDPALCQLTTNIPGAGGPFPLTLRWSTDATGPLSSATYGTPPFLIPAGTANGVYQLSATVGDRGGQRSTTQMATIALNPAGTAAAVVAEGLPTGATATISGQVAGFADAATTNALRAIGTVVLFATPGTATSATGPTNTITVTPTSGTPYTIPVRLTAGRAIAGEDISPS